MGNHRKSEQAYRKIARGYGPCGKHAVPPCQRMPFKQPLQPVIPIRKHQVSGGRGGRMFWTNDISGIIDSEFFPVYDGKVDLYDLKLRRGYHAKM